jgi:hypothetical protein
MLYDPEKHKAVKEKSDADADADNAVRDMIPEKVLSPKRIAQLKKNLRKIHLI